MGRKERDAHAGVKKGKPVSVSATIASMDAPPTKAAKATKSKLSKAPASSSYSYLGDVDLPPSDDDEEEAANRSPIPSRNRSSLAAAAAPSARDARKKERRQHEAAAAAHAEAARREALRNEGCKSCDPFSVVTGARGTPTAAAADSVRDIVLDGFSVSVAGAKLFDGATLRVAHGRRYGFVGPNGKGKSSLLRLLACRSCRKLPVPWSIDTFLVEQECDGDGRPPIEAVLAADMELAALRAERDRLEAASSGDDARLAEVYEELKLRGADAARARASKILAGLGFDQARQAKATEKSSGGWRMRVSLARALFMEPTLLLLDEPTNHLDLRAVMWLEEYLCTQWKKTLIVVSHDRDFLNTVCTDIINLHDRKLDFYRGNFDDFESGFEQKRTSAIREHKEFEKQEKAAKRSGNKAAHEKVIKQAMSKAEKTKGKGKNASNDHDDQKSVTVPQRWHDYCVRFHFPEPTELARPLLQLVEAGFSYPDFKMSGVDVDIDMGTRVAIVGPNGAGKSTLLKLLAGVLAPTEGQVRKSQKLRIGKYAQHFVDALENMKENAVEYLLRKHPDQEGMSKAEAVRAQLGKFGLPKECHLTPINDLSGGQKARVVFTDIVMEHPHVLLLDEPTNHLDMQSIDALADALDEFTGGVVLISHDSRLISRVCEDETRSQIWVVEDGIVNTFDGTFEDYKDELMEEIRKEVAD
ncbi:unnamed protein product [Urochloa decumbens]|uniref:ABC transporter domain-containing protein n=1 Tax=Urochloa decumbens TaxID=240449 RepID=A0ABC9A9A5_9POAL